MIRQAAWRAWRPARDEEEDIYVCRRVWVCVCVVDIILCDIVFLAGTGLGRAAPAGSI